MEKQVLQRIKDIISSKKISARFFSEQIGISQTTLNNQLLNKRGLSLEVCLAVLNRFEDISAEWLMRGTGTMFYSKIEKSNELSNNDIHGNGSGNIVSGNMQNVGNSRHYDVPASGFLKIIYPDGREETIAGDSSLLELSNEIKLLKAENAYLTDKMAMKDEVIGSMKELVLELKHKQ